MGVNQHDLIGRRINGGQWLPSSGVGCSPGSQAPFYKKKLMVGFELLWLHSLLFDLGRGFVTTELESV